MPSTGASQVKRVVTFCAHQPYLYLFKGMNWRLDLIQLKEQKRFLQNWRESVRPLPQGWRLVDLDQAKRDLAAGRYDLAIAHNINDYIDFLPFNLPRVLVMHTSLHSRFAEEQTDVAPEEYRAQFYSLITKTKGALVFVSEHKRRDWDLPGVVIPLVVSLEHYRGYTGEKPAILRVSNHLVERGEILDYPAHQRLSDGLPLTLIGENPSLADADVAESWDALRAAYRQHRLYLHTAKPGLEDGYNTAMLEAMATGMPVVSTAHPTSPIRDGVNGFVSDDLDELRRNVERLLGDRELAAKLGANARKTVAAKFASDRFHKAWRKVLKHLTKK